MANHLIIGLGGTGGSVLCALRKRIYEEFRSNSPIGDVHVEYLYVDSDWSDLNNEEDWKTLGESVQLSPAQRLLVYDIDPGVWSNLDQYPGIRSFIHQDDGKFMSEDTGRQRRLFGRIQLAGNMCGLPEDTFVGQVHARIRALKEKEDTDDVTFHICAGLGGSTGSGMIVDAIAQIRNEFQRTGDDNTKYKIQLYLYIPEKDIQFSDGEENNRFCYPNAYAALLELNAMSVGVYYPTDIKGSTDEYGRVRRLLKGQEAFDMAYLYTNVNENGMEVNIPKVLPHIVGDFLFHKIIGCKLSQERRGLGLFLECISPSLYPEENERKEPVHSRRFMTFGIKRIEYPETEVVEYGAFNYARQASLQMLYGLWDESQGYIACTEEMVGSDYVHQVKDAADLESNLLSDDYLTLSKPLPSVEKNVRNWKPIASGWEFYTDRYKQDVMSDYQKEEWCEEFNTLTQKFFDSMYRFSGVKKFYFDSECQLNAYAEEICCRIENNLFNNWKNGTMSILEVHKYLTALISYCDEHMETFKERITKHNAYLTEEMVAQLDGIRRDWNGIGWLRDAVTNASAKTFGRFVDAKREELTLHTEVAAYGFAVKLLSEIANMLRLINNNSVDAFNKTLTDFAERMHNLAEERCKLSDVSDADLKCEVIKVYDPKQVRSTVLSFLMNEKNQKKYATDLRDLIVESAGTIHNGFSELAKKVNSSVLYKVALEVCVKNACKDMENYSAKHPNLRMVNVNILDKLRNTVCSTDDKRKQFVRDIYGAAQSLLTFNASEEGKGSPETAANCYRFLQLNLPMYAEDSEFRNDFIRDFGKSSKIRFDKDKDVAVNFKTNQMVVVTARGGFPLRYVDQVRLYKEKYDMLTKDEAISVHTECSYRKLYSWEKSDLMKKR